MRLTSIFVLSTAIVHNRVVQGGEAEFGQLITKLEADVLELAREVESLHVNRCIVSDLEECYYSNYDDCRSEYPNPTCGGLGAIGLGPGDSILWDTTVSSTRLPSSIAKGVNATPTDPSVIETVCFTRHLDNYFVAKRDKDREYWADFGVVPPQLHVGFQNGAFRIFPARHSEQCGTYDTRIRPWYVAGSSGPKNIVMVLDTSGSMGGKRLELLKEATKRVIDTLTIGDRIAIVPFNTEATKFARKGQFVYTASDENKVELKNMVDTMVAGGATDFYNAFTATFEILEDSFREGLHVNCNTAILFLTDGEMNPREDGKTEQDVLDFIVDGIAGVQERTGHSVAVFTYSVTDNNVDRFPKQLACAVDMGIWSKIVKDNDIVESLSSYFLWFAMGLGEDPTFAAWVEPYEYETGGILGTTVSAPIYDRSTTPPIFLGVAGIDFPLSVVDKVLGVQAGSQITWNRLAESSIAQCPSIEAPLCQLESFRRRSVPGEAGLCTDNCTNRDFVAIDGGKCPLVASHDYPSYLWQNTNNSGRSYKKRGGNCKGRRTMRIIAIVAAAVASSIIVFCCISNFHLERVFESNKNEELPEKETIEKVDI